MTPPPPHDPRMNGIYNTQGRMEHYSTLARQRPQVNNSEVSRVQLDSYIDKNKVTLIETYQKFFDLTIWFSSKTLCQICISIYCRESNSVLTQGYQAFNIPYLASSHYPTPSQEIKVSINLQSLDYPSIFTNDLHHIIIDIFPISSPNSPILRTFYQLSRNREQIVAKLRKQAIILNGTSTDLLNFYGKESNGENLCLICLTENKDTMILPCRHVCLCIYCSDRISSQINKMCPVCRGRVTEFVRIIE